MMSRSPLIQLVLVAMAVGVVILNIKPAVAEIRATQDDIVHYQEEIARVEAVNKLLTDNTNIINSISVDNTQALERYLPTKLDEIAILRDLEAIADTVGILPTALALLDQSPLLQLMKMGQVLVLKSYQLGLPSMLLLPMCK
jgi:hypothetical protein